MQPLPLFPFHLCIITSHVFLPSSTYPSLGPAPFFLTALSLARAKSRPSLLLFNLPPLFIVSCSHCGREKSRRVRLTSGKVEQGKGHRQAGREGTSLILLGRVVAIDGGGGNGCLVLLHRAPLCSLSLGSLHAGEGRASKAMAMVGPAAVVGGAQWPSCSYAWYRQQRAGVV